MCLHVHYDDVRAGSWHVVVRHFFDVITRDFRHATEPAWHAQPATHVHPEIKRAQCVYVAWRHEGSVVSSLGYDYLTGTESPDCSDLLALSVRVAATYWH